MTTIKYSWPLWLRELLHFGTGFSFGVIPWWPVWVIGWAYVLWKELYHDTHVNCNGKWLWETPLGEELPTGPVLYIYRWGPIHCQTIFMKDKGWLDLACYNSGIVVGILTGGLLW